MAEGVLRLPLDIVPMMRGIVHDELLFSIPEAQVDDVVARILAALSFDFRGIQILAEASKPGPSWGHCYDKKEA